LIEDYECVSKVSGIQFNVELEQVATSHDDFSTSDATTHDVGDFFKQSNLEAKTMIYFFLFFVTDSWYRKLHSALGIYF
jgi:hypothetical protein